MQDREPIPRPSPEEFFELAQSPNVSIIVGKGETERTFKFPRDLLAYHSPYFKACFGGSFKEGKEGVLRLVEDDPKHFELLGLYLRDGSAEFCPDNQPLEDGLKDCWQLIRFADKYDISDLANCAKGYLEQFFQPNGEHDMLWVDRNLEEASVDFGISTLPLRSPLLEMMAKGCLYMIHDLSDTDNEGASMVGKIVERNPNLAATMMRLVVSTADFTSVRGSLTSEEVRTRKTTIAFWLE